MATDTTIGATAGQAIGNSLKSIGNITGLSTIDSAIENFTNKAKYSDILNNTSSGNKLLNVNGTNIPLTDGKKGDLYSGTEGVIKKFDNTVNISQYLAPTTLALSSLDKMGSEIDKSIESSFLLQTFHIKATDILCAAFCFILSTLSCSARNDLYLELQNVVNKTQALKSGITAINKMVAATGAIAASIDGIKSSAQNLFSGTGTNNTSTILSSASTLMAAPAFLSSTIKPILTMLNMSKSYKFMMPDFEGKSLWDMSRHIMFLIESQAMQMADQALSKLIKPVEDILTKMTPAICFGPASSKIQRNILAAINKFKSYLLGLLAKLMVGDGDFNLKFQSFNLQSATALELLALAKVLEYLSSHFFDVATACGVSPCGPQTPVTANSIGNLDYLLGNDSPYKATTGTAVVAKGVPPIIANNIDDLANKLAPNLSGIAQPKIVVTPTQIISTFDLGTPPTKIINMINNGVLDSLLDNNFNIYISPNDNSVKVVNNIQRNCGE